MFLVVTGGSCSGKSSYAEERMMHWGDARRFYIATMVCFDEENRRIVRRHRKMRKGKRFETIEWPCGLENLKLPSAERVEKLPPASSESVGVLLEDASNLIANELFDPSGAGSGGALAAGMRGIDSLLCQCDNLVVVTNELFSDGEEYTPEIDHYRRVLGSFNRYLAARADEVIEMTAGIPVSLKSAD